MTSKNRLHTKLTSTQLVLFVLSRWCPYTSGRADKQIWDLALASVVQPIQNGTSHNRTSRKKKLDTGHTDGGVAKKLKRIKTLKTILKTTAAQVSVFAAGSLILLTEPFVFTLDTIVFGVTRELVHREPRLKNTYIELFKYKDTEFKHALDKSCELTDLAQPPGEGELVSRLTFVAVVRKFVFDKFCGRIPTHSFLDCSWHPHKPLLAVMSCARSNSKIQVYDVTNMRIVHELELASWHTAKGCPCWDPTGRYISFQYLCRSGNAEFIRLWDVFAGNDALDDPIRCNGTAIYPWDYTGKLLLVLHGYRTWGVNIYNCVTRKRVCVADEYIMVEWHPKKHEFISFDKTTFKFTLSSFDVSTQQVSVLHSETLELGIMSLVWSPCGTYVAFNGRNLMLWNVATRTFFRTIHEQHCSDLQWHPSSLFIMCSKKQYKNGSERTLVFNIQTGEQVKDYLTKAWRWRVSRNHDFKATYTGKELVITAKEP